jgi:fatty-acyl-CoA synthase
MQTTIVAPNERISPANAWLRALELTTPITRNRKRLLSTVVEEMAAQSGDAPALLSDHECLTYEQLARRINQYARWALNQAIGKGDVVGLFMTNRPEYIAIWLGINSVGGVVALMNTNLSGPALARCVDTVSPKHLIVAAECVEQLASAQPHISARPIVWHHGDSSSTKTGGLRIDVELERTSGEPLTESDRPALDLEDRALYIYTSGTTGLPKAANVSHSRVMQWAHWFAGMMGAQATDRLYNSLPMYHSVGGVLAPGAILAAGGALVIREKFSATNFWKDAIRWDCTIFQYIGELCRYLLHSAPSAHDKEHRIRMACGNGLAPEVWDRFKERFGIPQIFEFYASTEGGVSLFNIEGKRGAIGHVPGYLAHRFSPALVKLDVDKGEPVRDAKGFCVRCSANEAGEALGKAVTGTSNIGSRFEGYTDPEATERRILRDAFEPGDVWVRTGDLMRKDERGYFYFVDRVGDTFRWKGENVATSEVSETLSTFPGVRHANVYGVTIPSTEGRAGMAGLITDDAFDLAQLRRHLDTFLPAYARPLFLRMCKQMDLTGTFKYSKAELVRQGFDPRMCGDALYFRSPASGDFEKVDQALYDRIHTGAVRF